MPQKSPPIQTIRRSVANSLKNLQSALQADLKLQNCRSLRYESLEDRRVLSATGLIPDVDPGTADSAYVASDAYGSADQIQADEIMRLVVEVNGVQQELTAQNNLLQLVAGDSVEVVGIEFNSDAREGVFASEGYVNKISDLTSASLIDYNDGRFSQRDVNQEATGGMGVIGGLNGNWIVESGWDRMTINLMHYTETSTDVAGRFFVNMNVGRPDFEFDEVILDTIREQQIHVGDEVSIPARWLNNLAGQFHNYAEVDIYHSSNMDEIIWAGAAVGNVDSVNSVRGEFLNTRSDDPFTEKWTPLAEGEYVLKYYVDPEKSTAEANEDNNEYEIRLTVKAETAPVANDDRFVANTESLDVLNNDTAANGSDELQVGTFTQGEHGKVELNEDGTLRYTPEKGFEGTDEFKYVATNGNQVSNQATVKVVVEKLFEVDAKAIGPEDSGIKLNIETNYDSVLISGIPKKADLNLGKEVSSGVYQVSSEELADLEITPPAQSDVDFQLTVTPMDEGVAQAEISKTIDVIVTPVVDSGKVYFSDFGIIAGKNGHVPVWSYFADRDGSEQHELTLEGIPDFMELSKGEKIGSSWRLTASELKGLQISSEKTDASDWTKYRGKYAYHAFEVSFTLASQESDGTEILTSTGSFKIYAWQKTK